MRVMVAFLLGMMIIIPPAHAQTASAKDIDEGPICVGGPRWRPSFDESRTIEAKPVPDSYRRMFHSTEPCVTWAMGVDGIVDWHLRFGSAKSISAALDYIDNDNSSSVPKPAAYLPMLRAAFAAAMPDLKRAAALKQPSGLSYSVSYKFMQQSQRVSRLNQLLRVRESYVFFARHYLRAAEEFTDLALLTEAEKYISTANAAADFLAPMESKPPVQGQLYFNLHRFETDDFNARAALLRAQISRSNADLDRAEMILNALDQPMDKRMASAVYSGGEDFCDITDDTSDREAIETACRADDDAEQRVANLIINRAQHEAITAGMKGNAVQDAWPSWTAMAERLLTFEALPQRGRCCGRSAEEDRFRLLMTQAYYAESLATAAPSRAMSGDEKDGRQTAWYDALVLLSQAERLAPPYSAPARFTRVADRWLTLWKAGPTIFADSETRFDPMQDPEKLRFAEYLAASLKGVVKNNDSAALIGDALYRH